MRTVAVAALLKLLLQQQKIIMTQARYIFRNEC